MFFNIGKNLDIKYFNREILNLYLKRISILNGGLICIPGCQGTRTRSNDYIIVEKIFLS